LEKMQETDMHSSLSFYEKLGEEIT